MGKITVKHYLNKAIKPRIEGNKELYPLYVQVIANQTNFRLKSNFPFGDGYLKDSDLIQEFVKNSIELEEQKIKRIVKYIIESKDKKLLTAKYIKLCSENLWDILNKNFGTLFIKEGLKLGWIPDTFENSTFYEIKDILTFTESDIEMKFSDDYNYSRIAMNAIWRNLFDKNREHLKIIELTVFDFFYGNGFSRVMEAVKIDYGYVGADEEGEYLKIVESLNKLILLE